MAYVVIYDACVLHDPALGDLIRIASPGGCQPYAYLRANLDIFSVSSDVAHC